MNKSNQSGTLLLLALVLGATVYALMYFGSDIEKSNLSASFGQFSKNKSTFNFVINNDMNIDSEQSTLENRSDLSGTNVPRFKSKRLSINNTPSSNPDFQTTGVEQSSLQNSDITFFPMVKRYNVNYARKQTQNYAIGSQTFEYISNLQNPTKSDINTLILLDIQAAETALSSQQSSKRTTPALAGKIASVSTNLAASKTAKKIGGGTNPGEPEPSGSLDVGEGVWILLLFASGYFINATKRVNHYRVLKV